MSQSDVVYECEVPAGTLRATVGNYRGKRRVDLRLWVEPRDRPGAKLIPTPKGLSLPSDYADELLEAAEALHRVARRSATRASA